MCDINESFKLCTCSGKVDKTKPHWILEKSLKKEYEFTKIVGDFIPPDEEEFKARESYDKKTQYLLNELNKDNKFDFKYEPKENDKLTIVHSPMHKKHYLSYSEFVYTRYPLPLFNFFTKLEDEDSITPIWVSHLTLLSGKIYNLIFGWTKIFMKRKWYLYVENEEYMDISKRKEPFIGKVEKV